MKSYGGNKADRLADSPLVSIGMPVFNEERYLSETLDSLLEQEFTNFEIVARDNASADKTSEILERYAQRDERIRFYKSEKNIGEIANFNKVFELSRGKYFMWAAGHDLWDKTFLTKCVEVLEKDSSIVACFSFDKHIDENGKIIGVNKLELDARKNSRVVGFIKSVWILRDTIIWGLMRSAALRRTRAYIPVQGPDHVVRVELSLLGSFAQIKELLFSLRLYKQENPREALQRRLYSWNEFKKLPWLYMCLPHAATVYEYTRGACRLLPHLRQKIFYSAVAIIVGGLRYSKVITRDVLRLVPRIFGLKISNKK